MEPLEKDEIICHCYNVTYNQILKVIEEKSLASVAEIRKLTGATSGCGCCRPDVEQILDTYLAEKMRNLDKDKRKNIAKNVYKTQTPLTLEVLSNKIIANTDNLETCHIIFKNPNQIYPYAEGQSLGVIPPGLDENNKPHRLRLYSIASSNYGDLTTEPSLSLCVKRVAYKDKTTGQTIKGVCSNYLCDLKPGDQVNVTGPVGQSFLIPENPNANLILIATGTGIAPFRAFWKNLFNPNRTQKFSGNVYLFFGCPYTSSILYKEELDELTKKHHNLNVYYALSREEKNADGSKRYVHHALRQRMNEIYPMLHSLKTAVYLCGLKDMEKSVLEIFQAAAATRRQNWDELYKKMKNDEKRWEVEVY